MSKKSSLWMSLNYKRDIIFEMSTNQAISTQCGLLNQRPAMGALESSFIRSWDGQDQPKNYESLLVSSMYNRFDAPITRLDYFEIGLGDPTHPMARKLGDTLVEVVGSTSLPSPKADGSARVRKAAPRAAVNATTNVNVPLGPARAKSKIITPPWYRVGDIVRVVVGKKYFESVIRPTIADVQHEYLEALRNGRDKEASVIRWRGLLQILWVAIVSPVEKLIKKFGSLAG